MTRRIVTGHDTDGASVIVSDGESPWCASFDSIPGFQVSMLWATDGAAISAMDEFPDSGTLPESWVPAPGGNRLLIATFPPDSVFAADTFDGVAAHREQMENIPGLAEAFEADNPGMHKTRTLDYGVVLSGSIVLELDNGQTRELKANDIVVQRATRHAWRNPGSSPATVLFVLMGSSH
ncbi:cupin domain-containing protein [Paraburkholderia sp. BCC1876]|jgi:mannose-6-phosphate isomerase-like protein (cupin superfamily)|uniref:cupin domain-containing protein n=1 Tax=Paraburkholderia sp. BCC1876 TaxID=2676303 RepID=UPI001590ACBC|nr:cupin domain-containing protein [Paraburkholderia sp. BCC1876]